jgi:hypothetical protein
MLSSSSHVTSVPWRFVARVRSCLTAPKNSRRDPALSPFQHHRSREPLRKVPVILSGHVISVVSWLGRGPALHAPYCPMAGPCSNSPGAASGQKSQNKKTPPERIREAFISRAVRSGYARLTAL